MSNSRGTGLANDRGAQALPVRPVVVGRYKLCEEIAAGGMATIHFGRILGDGGFTRPVAIKRLHPHLARDPKFVAAFVEEAHLAARISHPNVVAMLDVVSAEGELLLVMEYVAGASLSHLLRAARTRNETVPVPCIAAVMLGALAGLHAVHEAADEMGKPLGLVHRDVSPQNIMVGIDGCAQVLDFGIAKATERRGREQTSTGVIKGKLGYMAPEQFDGKVTRRSDLYAAAVVLWEALAGQWLFDAKTDGELINRVLAGRIDPPSVHRPGLSPELDALVLRGLSMEPAARFGTAEEMATALRKAVQPAATLEVAEWVQRTGGQIVRQHAGRPSRGARMSLVSASLVSASLVSASLVSASLVSASGNEAPPTDRPIAAEIETKNVRGRPRGPRKAMLVFGAAGLAIGLVGAGIAMGSSDPVHAPKAIQAAPEVAPSTSAAPPLSPVSAAPPQAALLSQVTPTPTTTAWPSPKAPSSPAKHVSLPPRSSSMVSVSRSQGAKIMSALDSRD